MEGQRALGVHQKYLNLCSEDERRSYGFRSTWGWVTNDWIKIFVCTVSLRRVSTCHGQSPGRHSTPFTILVCFLADNSGRMGSSSTWPTILCSTRPNMLSVSLPEGFVASTTGSAVVSSSFSVLLMCMLFKMLLVFWGWTAPHLKGSETERCLNRGRINISIEVKT